MVSNLETIVLVKPEEYLKLDKRAVENYIVADQRVLPVIKESIIAEGERQLKNKTGFTKDNLPDESPVYTSFCLDGISFKLITTVRGHNPPYQRALDKITAFLEGLAIDWHEGRRKTGVKTYPSRFTGQKEPFVELLHLMHRVYWYADSVRELGVENKFDKIEVPEELSEQSLDRLVIPLNLAYHFDIDKPGAARLWYSAGKFYDEIIASTKRPLEEEMEKRSGIIEMPPKTTKYWEQVERYLLEVKTIPSPRRQPGKVFDHLFKVPQKAKPSGSKALPVVITSDNFRQIIEEYQPLLQTSLKKWKGFSEKIGELVVFLYGLQDEETVKEEFPFLPQYNLRRQGERLFISVSSLHARIEALQEDYTKNRTLHVHDIKPIV